MAWTLTPTRRVPSLVSSSVSAAVSLNRRLQGEEPAATGGHLEKYRLHVFPKNVLTARREISPRRTNHHGSRIAREEKQTIFETSHYGIQIFAHRAENLVHTAQLLSNLRDFLADKPNSSAPPANPVLAPPARQIVPRKCDPVCVLISCNGASVAPLTTIASPVETSSATSAIAAEFRRLGRISFRSSEIEMPTRTRQKVPWPS